MCEAFCERLTSDSFIDRRVREPPGGKSSMANFWDETDVPQFKPSRRLVSILLGGIVPLKDTPIESEKALAVTTVSQG